MAHLNLSIAEDLIKKCREKEINISGTVDKLLRRFLMLEKKDVVITNSQVCEFCNRQMRKATKQDLNGLTWLWPDERYICPDCLRQKSRRII